MPFNFTKLEIPEVILIEPKIFKDERGFFVEVYKSTDFFKAGIDKNVLQVNHSKSQKNVLRGLHYQKKPAAQAKFVTVVEGEIFDVAVDIRKKSPYYGRWVAAKLSSKNKNMLYIPEGFAHGFCVLSSIAQVIYYCTDVYDSKEERGIIWSDQQLKIRWPVRRPIVSKKDSLYPEFAKADNNFI